MAQCAIKATVLLPIFESFPLNSKYTRCNARSVYVQLTTPVYCVNMCACACACEGVNVCVCVSSCRLISSKSKHMALAG